MKKLFLLLALSCTLLILAGCELDLTTNKQYCGNRMDAGVNATEIETIFTI